MRNEKWIKYKRCLCVLWLPLLLGEGAKRQYGDCPSHLHFSTSFKYLFTCFLSKSQKDKNVPNSWENLLWEIGHLPQKKTTLLICDAIPQGSFAVFVKDVIDLHKFVQK